jgi:hypothetical protein
VNIDREVVLLRALLALTMFTLLMIILMVLT